EIAEPEEKDTDVDDEEKTVEEGTEEPA
ncbi:MAG: hypothetical protein JWR90_2367, partial [Marmoricola sp.]|nr:hypothetical protein [Marmoricola sp.]